MESMELYEGEGLAVLGVAVRRLDVRVENCLAGQIAVHARDADGSEIAALAFRTRGGTLRIGPLREPRRRTWLDRLLRRGADPDGPFEVARGDVAPTLELDVRVPVCTDLRLLLGGAACVRVGDVGGRLDLDLSGEVEAAVGAGLAARVRLSGAARLDIAGTEGALDLDLRGASGLRIAGVAGPDATLRLREQASCSLGAGEVETFALVADGGTAEIEATVVCDLSFTGKGRFQVGFARVLGGVEASWSGGGGFRVDARGPAEAGMPGAVALTAA